MIERRLLDIDPVTGIREEYLYDHAEDVAYLLHYQDVSKIIDLATAERNEGDKHGRWRGDMVKVASLSLVDCLELQKIGLMDKGYRIRDEAAFQVWLNEHSKLKTTPGNFA